MSELDGFEAGLQQIIGRPSYERPFVCEGSPLTCRALIVGSNPATSLGIDFWQHWEPGYGFCKREWRKEYDTARIALGKGTTPTRERIERIVKAANPVRCLETNVSARPSRTAAPASSDAFQFLLDTVQPSAVLAFGKDAASFFQKLWKVELPSTRFAPVAARWGSVQVLSVRHLRFYSYARAMEFGRMLGEAVSES